MKLIVSVLATIAVVNAYTCPSLTAINTACRDISVFPLTCSNPNVNVASCNEKQCNQPYIDNYAACQCRRSSTLFFEHSVNVEGLIRRCGIAGLTNPFGNPSQYRPGQGTQVFATSGGTRVFGGTTYFGGSTTVISGTTRIVSATAVVNGTWIAPGTTTWVSDTPGIVAGTSTSWTGSPTTAAPIEGPTATPVNGVQASSTHMSGGAIAGTVIGSLAALALACLLGWCWRKKRAQHTTLYSSSSTTVLDPNAARAPTRTVVTEKIEPVVVKSVPTTNTQVAGPGTTNYSTSTDNYNNANYNAPANTTYSSASTPTATTNTTHATYNTTPATSTGYNTQPRTGSTGAVNTVSNEVHSAVNTTNNAVGHGVNATGNAVGNGVNAAGNGVNSVGNEIRGASNSTGNFTH